MNIVRVRPTKSDYEGLRHPTHGAIGKESDWPDDQFTARRVADGAIARVSVSDISNTQPAAAGGDDKSASNSRRDK
jgi:hypothetical protein